MADLNPTPQVGNPSGQEPQTAPEPSGTTSEQTFSKEYVTSIRQEAAGYRTKVKELEAQIADANTALAENKALLQQHARDKAIILEAGKHGLAPDLAVKLVDVELDADGNPTGVAEAVQATIKAYPQLVGNGKAASTTTPANPATKTKKATLTRDDIRKMSPAEINSRWDEVRAVLKS